MPQSVKNARILTYGYDSDPARFLDSVNRTNIYQHATNMLMDLADQRVEDVCFFPILCIVFANPFQPHRPIIFLAHSLGGILVKDVGFRFPKNFFFLMTYILQVLKQSQDAKHKAELQPIFPSTFAIIFFGTPHRGSDWVSIAERAATFAVGKNDNRILRDLRVDSEILQRLVDAFAVMLKDDAFKVHSFIEGHGITDIPGFTGKVSSFYPVQIDKLD